MLGSLNPLEIALLIFVVLMIFNVIIFVHELGHFWAAKWRGLKIDRFQIWFGKPIWKKEIDGVQYGLGWIPAGGFVALPQMAPMEAIEGGNRDEEGKPLPPISPLDKIIVAFAGPLFSLLLALLAGVGVWQFGKPADFAPTQVVQEIEEGSPAEKAGFQPGDKITHINGREVNGWDGRLDSIFMQIVTSEGDDIEFTVERDGEPMTLTSTFNIPDTPWYQRKGLRRVGISPATEWIIVASVMPGSPAAHAGFEIQDRLVSVDGTEYDDTGKLIDFIKSQGTHPIEFVVERKGEPVTLSVTPQAPVKPEGESPMIGVSFMDSPVYERTLIHPTPFAQVADTAEMMWVTITKVISPTSSLGPQHLSGPVGIVQIKFRLLQMDHPWLRILAFMVLLNVNLAILNLLPFPVLDGGHITLAALEGIAGRPVQAKVLGFLQTGFALLLFGFMIFVTSKDIGDNIKAKRQGPEYVWEKPTG